MELRLKKLSQKDIRTLKTGAVAVAAIVLFSFAATWFEHWWQVRKSLAAAREAIKILNPSEAKRAGLLAVVPVFEMPQAEEKQKFLFRDKFKEQLKKAGLKSKPLEILSSRKSRTKAGYGLLRLRCTTEKCKFGQILDLLANLKENPYLVGVEELTIKCDPKKREEFELNITVSTFVR